MFDSDAATFRRSGLTRLRFARSAPLRGGWRGWMARGFGRADLMAVDPAEVVAAALDAVPDAEPGDPDARPDPWLLTPLHLVAGLKTVHLAPGGLLRLSPSESAEWCEAFARESIASGLRLRPVGPSGFLLQGLEAAGALTMEPARLLGDSLEDALPGGLGGPTLRAFLTECEMWLHGAPLNRRRSSRGDPPVTTLWPWGGGNPLREPLAVVRGEGRWPRVWADDGWVRALGVLSGQAVDPLPAAVASSLEDGAESGILVLPVAEHGLEALDREFISPAADALRSGRLARLTLAADDRAVSVTSGDRHRFWRPARDLLGALLEGGP